MSDAVLQVGVVFDALEVFFFGACILADKGVMGTAESVAGNAAAEDERSIEFGDLAGGGDDGLRGCAWCSQRVSASGDSTGIGAGGW